MAGYTFPKVLDFESTFETGGEEAAEGRDEGGEGRENKHVKLHGGNRERAVDVGPGRQMIWSCEENGVGIAGQAGKEIGTKVLLLVVNHSPVDGKV